MYVYTVVAFNAPICTVLAPNASHCYRLTNKEKSKKHVFIAPQLQVRPRLLDTPRLIHQIRLPRAVLAGIPPRQGTGLGQLLLVDLARRGVDAGLERLEQLHRGLGGQVLVVLVVDLDHGRVDAGAQALDFDEGEKAVGGGLALLNAEVGLDGLDDGVGAAAAELARGLWVVSVCVLQAPVPFLFSVEQILRVQTYRSAGLDVELPHWRPVVHGVETRHLVDSHRRHLQQPRDLIHDADRRETVLALTQIEDGHNGSLLVLRRVTLEDFGNDGFILGVELEGDIGVVVGGVAVLNVAEVSQLISRGPDPGDGTHHLQSVACPSGRGG